MGAFTKARTWEVSLSPSRMTYLVIVLLNKENGFRRMLGVTDYSRFSHAGLARLIHCSEMDTHYSSTCSDMEFLFECSCEDIFRIISRAKSKDCRGGSEDDFGYTETYVGLLTIFKSPNISMHFLLTVLHIVFMALVGSHVWSSSDIVRRS